MSKEASGDGVVVGGTKPASSVWALVALSLSMLLSSLGTSVANVALPTLAQAFGSSFQGVQWVVLAYLLAVTVPIVGVGRLGDLTGRRRLLLSGVFLFTAASVLCGAASSLWLLTAARALQGLGAAVMMALTVAFVGDAVPEARTGVAMGLLGTMSAVGTALGPSLGGMLLSAFGWQAVFFANVPLGVLIFALAFRHLPVDGPAPGGQRTRFDTVGTLILAVTLAAYALAMTTGRGRAGAPNVALLVAAVFGAVLFVHLERRTASPLIELSLLRDPALSAGLAMNALVSTVMMATLVVGPFYLSRALGLEVSLVGLALSASPLASALTGVPAGLLVDRHGERRIARVGLAAMLACSTVVAVTPASLGAAAYVAPVVVLTVGYALFQAANNTAMMTRVGRAERGVVAGMLGLSRNLGLITGASVMGALFAFASAASDVTVASPEAIGTGMRVTFGAAAALCASALALAFASSLRPQSR
jgi:EmrB/QacA subfamily drug resistance transporter